MEHSTHRPKLYLIGGPNGAGKTTFSKEYLPNEANCLKFLNSDEIAKGLSPLDSSAAQVQAGRILLQNLRRNLANKESFALESTLSGKTYLRYLQQAKELGYYIELYFLWLPSATESHERVKQRVSEGGHAVSQKDIYRRYPRILQHLFDDYMPIVDEWQFWDASKLPMDFIASSATLSIKQLKKIYV